MTIDTVTKKAWAEYYHEGMVEQANDIKAVAKQFQTMVDNYNNSVAIFEKYRTEIKTHRIIHQIDLDKGVLSYKLGAKRKIGFNYKGK